MALVMNTRTGKVADVPEHYLGHPILGADLVLMGDGVSAKHETIVSDKAEKSVSKKKPAKYVPDAVDGDGDGLVQDGTIWERPEGTEIEGHSAPEDETENNEE